MVLAAALSSALVAGCSVPAVPAESQIEEVIAATATYDYGQSSKRLRDVERLIRETHGHADRRACLERQLVKLLESDATTAAKQFVCRQLWIIGTDASVPELGKMLLDEKTAEMACYALGRHPSPAVGRVLREALAKARGKARVPIINLLGDRRDAQSVPALAKLTGSPEMTVSDAAVAALGKIATDQAAKLLADLRKSDDAKRRAAATHAYLQCARGLAARNRSAEAKVIYEQLTDLSEPVHIRRGAFLGRVALGGPEAVSLVISTLRGKDDALKPTAIASIRTLCIKEK